MSVRYFCDVCSNEMIGNQRPPLILRWENKDTGQFLDVGIYPLGGYAEAHICPTCLIRAARFGQDHEGNLRRVALNTPSTS